MRQGGRGRATELKLLRYEKILSYRRQKIT